MILSIRYKVRDKIKKDNFIGAIKYIELYYESRNQNIPSYISILRGNYRRFRQAELLISRENSYTDKISILKIDFLRWVDENFDKSEFFDESPTEIERAAELSLRDIKERVDYYLATKSIKSAIVLVKKILKSPTLLNRLTIIETEFNDLIWKLNNQKFDISEWEKGVLKIENLLEKIILEIDIDKLVINWKTIYTNLTLGTDSSQITPYFALFSKADKILLPKELKPIEKQKYKRLMYLYQDAYQAGNYKDAYDYCLEIRSEIEPESAQLYEYLLLSYFKKQNEERVVEEAIQGNDRHLKYLFVYSSRYRELQEIADNEYDIPKSSTGNHNLVQIATGLNIALSNEYSKIRYDYLVGDKKYNIYHQLVVKRCLMVATDINRFICSNVGFAEIIVTELCGGSKFKWIELNDGGELVNVGEFDAITYLRNARKLLEYNNLHHSKREDINHQLADNLLFSLKKKLISIDNSNIEEKVYRLKLYQLIIAHKISSVVFPDDNRFCIFPVKELSEKRSQLEWFTLSPLGELSSNFSTKTITDINIMQLLQDLYVRSHGAESWIKYESDLKIEASIRLQHRINLKYNSIGAAIISLNMPNHEYFLWEDKLIVHRTVEDCLINWNACFKVGADKKLADKILNEVVGNGYFFHFNMREDDLVLISHSLREYLNLIELVNCSSTTGIDQVRKSSVSNFCDRHLVPQYKWCVEVLRLNLSGRNKDAIIAQAINQLCTLADVHSRWEKSNKIYNFVYEELIGESFIMWFDISEKGSLKIHKAIDFNNKLTEQSLNELLTFLSNQNYSNKNYYSIIAENRLKEILFMYDHYFSISYWHNRTENHYIRMAKIIIRSIDYFKLTSDMSYLEIPFREIISNNSKVKWYYQIPHRMFGLDPYFRSPHKLVDACQEFDIYDIYKYLRLHYQ